MNIKIVRFVLSLVTAGLASTWQIGQVKAAIIGRETPDTLSLTFSGLDAYPPGNSPFSNGPLISLFSGQYWQVSAQSRIAPTGPATGFSNLFVQQVIPGQTTVPQALFGTTVRLSPPSTQSVSYLASSPAQTFNQVSCPVGSANCVFFQLQGEPSPNVINGPREMLYQLQGSFQTALPTVSLSDTPLEMGAFAAFSLIMLLRIQKTYRTKS